MQLIGGDSGWSGDIDVAANGTDVGFDWTEVADGNGSTAELFAFPTTAGVGGSLELFLTGFTQFAGVAGVIVSSSERPPAQSQLTDTSQIRTATNDPVFADQPDLAAVNFYYAPGGTSTGTVHGVGDERGACWSDRLTSRWLARQGSSPAGPAR